MSKETTGMRDKTSGDLREEVRALREQLFKLRWQASGGQAENPNRIRAVRRDIARHLTLIRERDLASARQEA